MSRVIGTAKASRWLGVSERSVRRLCAQGRLPGAYQPAGYAGKWLVPLKALKRLRATPADPSLSALAEGDLWEREPVA